MSRTGFQPVWVLICVAVEKRKKAKRGFKSGQQIQKQRANSKAKSKFKSKEQIQKQKANSKADRLEACPT